MDFSVQWDEFIKQEREAVHDDPVKWLRWAAMTYRYRDSWWVLKLIEEAGEVIMARGVKKNMAQKNSVKSAWTDFVDISMTGHTADMVNAEIPYNDAFMDMVSGLLGDAYKLSITYNQQNDSFIASLTCRDDDSVNAGATMTAFAGDWLTAIRVVLYKHYVIAQGNWRKVSSARSRDAFG